MRRGFLGIDVGSISTNVVFLDGNKNLLFESYARVGGNPIDSVKARLKELASLMREKEMEVGALCTTGSGRQLVGVLLGADVVKNEISAHARAAVELHPDVRTIIEIGGQDSKVIIIENGMVVDFAMNLVCAAGTGSFLDSQARRLDITIEELSRRSILSKHPTAIAARCTVFSESDMISKQQMGHAQEDIIMGLCHALARNFIGNVARGKQLCSPVLLQGGVSANLGILRAFENALGCKVIVPRHHMVMGAYGAALLAMETDIDKSRFRGADIWAHHIHTQSVNCEDCPNNCEIIEIIDTGEVVGRTGGRCGKW
ncbi:MAG TPA: acyl-CoA dehydratase activase [Smithellaceae bacterium]|nr:acyl-CoA dehydratase activase [Smithellaceae bacterium]HRS89221.1 acyl-CoA dehydratase activase [Smithellaceae bacterium]HRV26321.1 acyl-CoA dehydratase activase [Smithellaceae bacterium]